MITSDKGLVEFVWLLDWHKANLIEVVMMDDGHRGQSMLID